MAPSDNNGPHAPLSPPLRVYTTARFFPRGAAPGAGEYQCLQ